MSISLKERNAQIAEAYNSGLYLAGCAIRFGMSKQNVHQILKACPDVELRPANAWTERTRQLRGDHS